MLWPPPLHAEQQALARARTRPPRRRRAPTPAARRAPGGVAAIAFQSVVASSQPSSPGSSTSPCEAILQRLHVAGAERGAAVPSRRATRTAAVLTPRTCRQARAQARRTNASGCSSGGSSAGVVDDVQRPAVAVAGRLGHAQRDRRGRGGPRSGSSALPMLRERRGRDRAIAERLQRRADGREHARGAGAVEVVGLERPPTAGPCAPSARRGRGRRTATAWRGSPRCGSAMNAPSACAHRRLGCERREAEAVHEHELAQGRRPRGGEPGGDRAAEDLADDDRRLGAGRGDQLVEPRDEAGGVERAVQRLGQRRGPAGRARSRGGRATSAGITCRQCAA